VNLVIQQDPKGCGVASLAMVCGETYEQTKSKMGDAAFCWEGSFTHYALTQYLAEAGFCYQFWWAYDQFKMQADERGSRQSSPRVIWPIPTPFAEAHILLTRGEEMGHWVAMDDQGEIFDPVRGRGKSIGEYDVTQIVGAWRKKEATK
jgi:hypothetical protein